MSLWTAGAAKKRKLEKSQLRVGIPLCRSRTIAFAVDRLGCRDRLRANLLAPADKQSSHSFVAGAERLNTVD